MVKCSLDTNMVAILATIYACKNEGRSADSAYKDLVADGFTYGVDVFRRACKILKKIEIDEVKIVISPIVAEELHHPNIPKDKVQKIDAFLFEQRTEVIDTEKFDYTPLVALYFQAMGEEGVKCFKEKSVNDAYIMAHTTYAGLPLVTCNFSDFTKGQRPERIRQRNEMFYKNNHLENDARISPKFKESKPYTPYHFVEEYLPKAEREFKFNNENVRGM